MRFQLFFQILDMGLEFGYLSVFFFQQHIVRSDVPFIACAEVLLEFGKFPDV